jgi:hypothetical protein
MRVVGACVVRPKVKTAYIVEVDFVADGAELFQEFHKLGCLRGLKFWRLLVTTM